MLSTVFRLSFVILVLLVAACGPGTEKNLCGDTTCEAGVCDPNTGLCANSPACGETSECLDGFECVESQCIADFACNMDGTCDRGDCIEGACVNPDRCAADNDCVPGYGCDGDSCIVDQCDLVDCDRGVCEKSTGECVNSAVCTRENEATDCLEGFACYDQSCADEETICSELDCGRGVCSFTDRECVNAESCEGSDMNCLEGFFCNAGDQCQRNVCDENMVDCALGVCDPRTGGCINAEPCAAGDECTDGFYCIRDTCVEQDTACEECPGNQECGYDNIGRRVFCQENESGCGTSVDCVDDRECVAGTCGEPEACVPDAFEPNDSQGAAIDWFTANNGTIDGTICSGDSDFIAFDVSQDPEFTGSLIASVGIPAEDIGIGSLTLELLDESGSVVASTTSDPTDSFVRIDYQIGNINQGVYTLSIADSGDIGSGVEYSLFMDLLDENAAAACANAPTLTQTTVMGDTSMSASNGLDASCASDPAGAEDVYQIEVSAAAFVEVDVLNADFDAVVSIRRQCEAVVTELACANATFGVGDESFSLALDPGRYSIIVDGASGSDDGEYMLNVAQLPIVCDQSDNLCVDMTTASTCNGRGTGFSDVTCEQGCDMATGSCIREVADVCSTAIDATGGYEGTITLGNLDDDYQPGATCVPEGFTNATVGPDGVFSVALDAGAVLFATATPAGFDDVSMYVVENCGNTSGTCLAGVNDNNFDDPEEIIYTNNSAAAKDVFLVVDSESASTGDVAVSIVTGPVICTPGEAQCNGSDLETCNVAGTGYNVTVCNFGCDSATTACTPPPNDQCGMGAIDVSAGGTFTGTIDDYNDDYNNPNSCTGFSANGADAIYVVTGTPGDIVDVTLNSGYDASLYAVTSCGDVANSCLDGSDNIGSAEEIQFVIPDANPVYIVADAFTSSPSGTFTLDVTVRTPDCTNYNEAITCSDTTTLQYCDETGFFADYTCETTCSGMACDAPTGDRCFDTIPIASGGSHTGNFTDLTEQVNPGLGTCLLDSGTAQVGPDAIFEIQLTGGELLEADLTTSAFGAGMYILRDCGDARDSCAWAEPVSDRLEYFAPASDTYFLVVDSTSTTASGPFTLDVLVTANAVCQPGGATCDSFSDTLSICSDDGAQVTATVNCADGCTDSGYCNPPVTPNDTCATAAAITESTRFIDSFARFADDLDPSVSTNNTCGITDADGLEAVYTVSLAANEVLDVTVSDLGEFGDLVLYVSTDCATAGDTCVQSVVASDNARLGYVAANPETVTLVIDNTSAFADGNFTVDLDIRPAQCVAGSTLCVGDVREYCDEFGELQTQDCYFGCGAGACSPPTNDTCAMPIDATGGGSWTIPADTYVDDYDVEVNGCTGFATAGPDAVFKVTATAGDVITATLNTDSYDSALYVTTTCGDQATCIAGDDVATEGGEEQIAFVASADGDYFIYADAYVDSFVVGPEVGDTFTLDVAVQQPICTPGAAACDATGTNIETCNNLGTATEVYACDSAGCAAGTEFCTSRNGEFCGDAIDANASGMFTGTYSDFANDLELGQTSCTGFSTPGPEAVYSVDLLTGETLTATLNSTDDSSLYILSSCSTAPEACLDGDDTFGSAETVTYTAVGDERVFVVADAFTSSPTSTYTLNITVQ